MSLKWLTPRKIDEVENVLIPTAIQQGISTLRKNQLYLIAKYFDIGITARSSTNDMISLIHKGLTRQG